MTSVAIATPQGAGTGQPGDPAEGARGGGRPSGTIMLVYALWFLVIGNLQWLLATWGATPLLKLPTLMLLVAAVLALNKGPRTFFPPLLVFAIYTVASVPFAFFRGDAIPVAKTVVIYYALSIVTLTLIRTVKQAVPLLLWVFLFQYTWWVAFGARAGEVLWEGIPYANFDGYGPLMTLGIGACFFIAMATKNFKLRMIGFLSAGGCVVGLVSSFARGAVASAAVVALWIWLRSKHKLKTMGLGIVAALVLYISATYVFVDVDRGGDTQRNLFDEMLTVADTGGTRSDRVQLWKMATIVYTEHPFFGAGPGNFGAYAARQLDPDQISGDYSLNQGSLWGRRLHSIYYQILSEFGTVGIVIFVWLLLDFWRRNRALRKPERIAAWNSQTDVLDLRNVSLGLEVTMLAFLLTGYFYNTLFEVPWFYTLVTMNLLLFNLTKPGATPGPRAAGTAAPAAAARRGPGWRTTKRVVARAGAR